MGIEPLTFEQLFGVPASEIEVVEAPVDFCPYKRTSCPAWDDDCQLDICIMNGVDDGTPV